MILRFSIIDEEAVYYDDGLRGNSILGPSGRGGS